MTDAPGNPLFCLGEALAMCRGFFCHRCNHALMLRQRASAQAHRVRLSAASMRVMIVWMIDDDGTLNRAASSANPERALGEIGLVTGGWQVTIYGLPKRLPLAHSERQARRWLTRYLQAHEGSIRSKPGIPDTWGTMAPGWLEDQHYAPVPVPPRPLRRRW